MGGRYLAGINKQGRPERSTGVEPASRAWEARVIPLYDDRSGRPCALNLAEKPEKCQSEAGLGFDDEFGKRRIRLGGTFLKRNNPGARGPATEPTFEPFKPFLLALGENGD